MPTPVWMLRGASLALLLCAAGCVREATAPVPSLVAAGRLVADRGETDESGALGQTVTFENFTLGDILTQFDWQSTAGLSWTGPGSRCGNYDHAIADYPALVPAPFRNEAFGRRSLRISNAVTSGCYNDATFSHRSENMAGETGAWAVSSDGAVNYAFPGATLQNHFDAEWTFMSAVPGARQDSLEVVISPARGDNHRMSWVQLVDLADGLAVVFAARADPLNPGAFQRDTIARRLDRRSAHTVRLSIDFVDGPQNDIVRLFVDGTLRHTGGSWETYYQLDGNGRGNFSAATPVVNRLMFRTGSDTHRGVTGNPSPTNLGRGFLFDRVRVATFMVATSAAMCRNGGWRDVRTDSGKSFDNQGDCVEWVQKALRERSKEH